MDNLYMYANGCKQNLKKLFKYRKQYEQLPYKQRQNFQ